MCEPPPVHVLILASLYIELERLIDTYAVGFLPPARCSPYISILRATESHSLTFCACAGVTVVRCRTSMHGAKSKETAEAVSGVIEVDCDGVDRRRQS